VIRFILMPVKIKSWLSFLALFFVKIMMIRTFYFSFF
jgi:hypothetical protein